MESLLMWLTAVFDTLGVLASIVAAVVYGVLYFVTSRALTANGEHDVVISATRFKRWVRVNAIMAVLVGLNAARWLVLSDIAKLRGVEPTTTGLDDLTWAVCDLFLIVLPIILIGNMRSALREKGGDRV